MLLIAYADKIGFKYKESKMTLHKNNLLIILTDS